MRNLLLFVIFLSFFLIPFSSFAADTDVVINEVLPDPSGNENSEEFIELFNKFVSVKHGVFKLLAKGDCILVTCGNAEAAKCTCVKAVYVFVENTL